MTWLARSARLDPLTGAGGCGAGALSRWRERDASQRDAPRGGRSPRPSVKTLGVETAARVVRERRGRARSRAGCARGASSTWVGPRPAATPTILSRRTLPHMGAPTSSATTGGGEHQQSDQARARRRRRVALGASRTRRFGDDEDELKFFRRQRRRPQGSTGEVGKRERRGRKGKDKEGEEGAEKRERGKGKRRTFTLKGDAVRAELSRDGSVPEADDCSRGWPRADRAWRAGLLERRTRSCAFRGPTPTTRPCRMRRARAAGG